MDDPKGKRRVIFGNDRKRIIIDDVHERSGDNLTTKAFAAHCGRESIYQKLAERFYWHSMVEDVKEYISKTAKTVNSKEKCLIVFLLVF